MAKAPQNNGKPWSKEDIKELKQHVQENTPTRVIGIKLGRSPDAVYSKSASEGISLKPTNQRPYGTKKR